MKTSEPSPRRDRRLPFWKRLAPVLLSIGLIAGVSTAARAQVYLPPLGGGGGGQFKAPCAAGQNLTGFDLRVADDVDAIRPICVTAYGPHQVGGEVVADSWNGGSGGHDERLVCPPAAPVVLAISVGAEGQSTFIVNNIHLFCGLAVATNQALEEYPSAIFDGPGYKPTPAFLSPSPGTSNRQYSSQRCPAGKVAVGVHGRSGVWLDAMGLICDAPQLSTPPVALGRVPTQPGPAPAICDAAQAARARNSPAAASLERQCAATRPPPVALGRVPASATPDSRSICQAAADARARNSPAAPSLEAQCRAAQARANGP